MTRNVNACATQRRNASQDLSLIWTFVIVFVTNKLIANQDIYLINQFVIVFVVLFQYVLKGPCMIPNYVNVFVKIYQNVSIVRYLMTMSVDVSVHGLDVTLVSTIPNSVHVLTNRSSGND